MILEYVYLVAIIIMAVSGIILAVCTWGWWKHVFWEIVWWIPHTIERVGWWCVDKVMGCKGKQTSRRR